MNKMVNEKKGVSREKFYTIAEIAEILSVSERTVRRYCESKLFEHAIKIGKRKWLIPGCDTFCFFDMEVGEKEDAMPIDKESKDKEDDDGEGLSW